MKRFKELKINRDEYVPNILNDNNLKNGLEIGTFKGEFAKIVLDKWDGILYMVDPWKGMDDYEDASNHKHHNEVYSDVIKNLEGYENRAFMLRGKSEDLNHLFSDSSLDFIYIDGNHSYEYVKLDLELWWDKIKVGGFLMGHDYLKLDWNPEGNFAPNGKDKYIYGLDGKYRGIFGVNPAVDEFCDKHDLNGYMTDEWHSTFVIEKSKNYDKNI